MRDSFYLASLKKENRKQYNFFFVFCAFDANDDIGLQFQPQEIICKTIANFEEGLLDLDSNEQEYLLDK